MKRILSALAAGMIFGAGIAISGMGNPAKVLNFFDPFGTWDPSLAFVMGGALLTTAVGYRLLLGRRQAPLFDTTFHLPTARTIDVKLVGGAALFGVGWGIAGFCPGGAVPALGPLASSRHPSPNRLTPSRGGNHDHIRPDTAFRRPLGETGGHGFLRRADEYRHLCRERPAFGFLRDHG